MPLSFKRWLLSLSLILAGCGSDTTQTAADLAQLVPNAAGIYAGGLDEPQAWAHVLKLVIEDSGEIHGSSVWNNVRFSLNGTLRSTGEVTFTDNADQVGQSLGIYTGVLDPNYGLTGSFHSDRVGDVIGTWSAKR